MPRIHTKLWIVCITIILIFAGALIYYYYESSEIEWDILKEDFLGTTDMNISGGKVANGSFSMKAQQFFDCDASSAKMTIDLDYDKFLIEIAITDIWMGGMGILEGSFMSNGMQFSLNLEWDKFGVYQYVFDNGKVSEYENGTLLHDDIPSTEVGYPDGFYFYAEACGADLFAAAGITLDRIYITSQEDALKIIKGRS